jgi:hypothetical protein
MFKASFTAESRLCEDLDLLDKDDQAVANSIFHVIDNAIDPKSIKVRKHDKYYILICHCGVKYIDLTKLSNSLSKYDGSIQNIWVEYDKKILCVAVKCYSGMPISKEETKRRIVKPGAKKPILSELNPSQIEGLDHITDPIVIKCIKTLMIKVIQHQLEKINVRGARMQYKYINAKMLEATIENHSQRLEVNELFANLSRWVSKHPQVNGYIASVDIENKILKLSIDIDTDKVAKKRKIEEDETRNVIQKV